MSAWRERGWKLALLVGLVGVAWLMLAPQPPLVPGGVGGFPFADKLQHVVLFAALGLLAARAYRENPRWGLWLALVLYGVALELAQARTGRSPEPLDALADALGAAIVFVTRKRG